MSDKKYHGLSIIVDGKFIGKVEECEPKEYTGEIYELDMSLKAKDFLPGKVKRDFPEIEDEEGIIVEQEEVKTYPNNIPIDIALNASQETIHKDLKEIRIAKGDKITEEKTLVQHLPEDQPLDALYYIKPPDKGEGVGNIKALDKE